VGEQHFTLASSVVAGKRRAIDFGFEQFSRRTYARKNAAWGLWSGEWNVAIELVLPELDLPGVAVVVSAWHGKVGEKVVEGDRLVEVTAGDVTVDLAAPASGVLAERCVRMDERLTVGQILARIRPE